MGHNCDGQGDRQSAIQYYQRAVEIFRDIGDQWAINHPLCDLAWKTWDQGFTQKARALMEEHLSTFRKLQNNTWGLSMALGYMFTITTEMGDFETAALILQEKRAVDLSFQTELSDARVLTDMGYFDFLSGRLGDARPKLEAALSTLRKKSDSMFTSDVLKYLGNVLVQEGQVEEGLALLEESLALAKSTGSSEPYWLPGILSDYSLALLKNGELKNAQKLLCQSLEGVRNTLPRLPGLFERLAHIAQAMGDSDRAVKLISAAQSMRKTMAIPVMPVYREDAERVLQNLQKEMSENAFQQSWNEGAEMTADECIEYALAVREDI